MAHDTSPFAFPQTPGVSPSGDVYDPSDRYGGGMTLRDYFAGLALPGIAFDCGLEHSEAAERCYSFADAMIAERSKKQPDRTLDALKGLIGLVDMIRHRDDLPPAVLEAIDQNHRLNEAVAVAGYAQAETAHA